MERRPAERFEVLAVLGRGASGVVYRALDRAVGREVALKVLEAPLDPEATAQRRVRFAREGEVAAALSHPGIVRVHTAGELPDGRAFLAYELVEGARTLSSALPELARAERCRALLEAAQALGHAHARGVIHRDVKPDNLLLDLAGRVRVTDFGVAAARGLARMTGTGVMIGTPLYMAPEQFGGRRDELSPAADVWSLGVVLYEALTGTLPFGGATLAELAAAIARGAPAPPRALDKTIPAELEAVCLQALRPDPAARYPDAEAFAADLARALQGERVSAPSSRWVGPWSVPARRAVLGAPLLAALAVLAWAALGPAPAPTRAPPRPADEAARQPEREPAPLERWGPEVGSRRRTRLERHVEKLGPGPAVPDMFWVAIDLTEEVKAVEGELAEIEVTLERVRVRFDVPITIDLDTKRDAGTYLALRPGQRFTYWRRLPSGAVEKVRGASAARRSLIHREAGAELGRLLDRALAALDDQGLVATMGLLSCAPEAGPLVVRQRMGSIEVIPVELRLEVTREAPGRFEGRLLGARALDPARAGWLRELALRRRSLRFAAGWLEHGTATYVLDFAAPNDALQGVITDRYQVVTGEDEVAPGPGPFERSFRQAAARGDVESMAELADLLIERGEHAEGVEWARRAAARGNGRASALVGRAHELGQGAEGDFERALARYLEAGERGFAQGFRFAADMIANGKLGKRSPGEARALWRRAGEGGDGMGWLALARALRDGRDGAPDLDGAAEAARHPAREGSTESMVLLAELLLLRPGLPAELRAEGRDWLQRALAAGSPRAEQLVRRHPALR